jgi:aminoglycoside phosphotransferase (APT) family kinase protein
VSELESPEDATAIHLHTLSRDPQELRGRLQEWLAGHLGDPTVSELSAPSGNGVSSDTVLFDVTWGAESPGEASPQVLVRSCVARLQPDPSSSPVFPDYDLEKQARIIKLAGDRTSVPVPTILWEEYTGRALGTPFFVMERVQGEVPPDIMPYPFGSWLSEATADQQRALQDASVGVLADLHGLKAEAGELEFLEYDEPGDTALRRHVNATRSYYEWVASDGCRSPLIERGFRWLEDHWPGTEGDAVVSWGDARIGNMMFRDFAPVAVLDWEMVALGPREIDLGWMVALHRFLDDIALGAGMEGMPQFMRLADAAATYEARSGVTPRDLEFYATYGALRMAVVISREQRRGLAEAGQPLPPTSDGLILQRAGLEEMLEGTYWDRF